MLTDIFAIRYGKIPIWDGFKEAERRLLVQSFRIVSEQICPYYDYQGKEIESAASWWNDLNKALSMELGLKDLSDPVYGYYQDLNGSKRWVGGSWSKLQICEKFVLEKFSGSVSPDQFVKERLSFIELAFRKRFEFVSAANANLDVAISEAINRNKLPVPRHAIRLPGDPEVGVRARNAAMNSEYNASVEELNERFRQADCPLNYHNGFIQISSDKVIERLVEKPFWDALKDSLWKNVDVDMKEAIDLRDNGGRDPAWYAAKALESTVKIISDQKGWTHGGEKGATNFLENLSSKKNGEFLKGWEKDNLQIFFKNVRNPFGHGAGSEEMPTLSEAQTDWSIEFCMVWIRNLIRRM